MTADALAAQAITPPDPPGTHYDAYIAYGLGALVAADAATGTETGLWFLDTPQGVAATPDGSQIFVAQTGKWSVVALARATGAMTTIEVGPFPQDVAVSPDGSTVYATVTGSNTGPGGSNQVAAISTATLAVTGYITVGTSPRRVVFSPDGSRAYVTTAASIDVIATASGRVVRSIPDPGPGGPQDLAISPDGRTLYVTNPVPSTLWVIDTSSFRVTASLPGTDPAASPYSVAVSPDGTTVYVTELNTNSVRAISTATLQTIATIGVGSLPGVVAVTPDGTQVWVGNILAGSISIIAAALNEVVLTTPPGPITIQTWNGEPISIVFVRAS